MKRQLVFPGAVLCLGLIVTATAIGVQDALRPMTGRWKAMLSYTERGGRFTVSLAEETEVKQIDRNTIGFSLKPVAAPQPVFDVRLTHDAATTKYLVSVKSGGQPTLEGLALTYAEGSGWSGDGTLKDAGGQVHKVLVTIVAKSTDQYEWSFLDPAAPAQNNIVFSFSLFKRL